MAGGVANNDWLHCEADVNSMDELLHCLLVIMSKREGAPSSDNIYIGQLHGEDPLVQLALSGEANVDFLLLLPDVAKKTWSEADDGKLHSIFTAFLGYLLVSWW
ncbi:hypothetical protein Dimus_031633 [Dionaea muscipula]